MADGDARRELITETWAAAWDRGDVTALDSVLDPRYRRRTDASDEGQDLDAFKASITAIRSAFPDLTTTIDDILVEGDRAAVRWHSRGRHDRPFLGVPPTHREVQVAGATFARFEGDRVVEEFVTWDPRALLSALGIISVGQDG
jgi:predicted ester cyclase